MYLIKSKHGFSRASQAKLNWWAARGLLGAEIAPYVLTHERICALNATRRRFPPHPGVHPVGGCYPQHEREYIWWLHVAADGFGSEWWRYIQPGTGLRGWRSPRADKWAAHVGGSGI